MNREDIRLFEEFVQKKMAETNIPGMSVAVVEDGEITYSRGFGFRDVEAGLPATSRSLYGIGSVTKSFTALAIMQLVEKGLLSLDDPVEKYVPLDLKVMGEPVRVIHLLTHSLGIPALGYAEAFIRGSLQLDTEWIPLASYDDIFTFMKGSTEWAEAKPGEKFFYLNEGYVLLGYIIEKVSGIKYEEYVYKNILGPIGMKRTFFEKELVEKDPDKATAYIITREGKRVRSWFPYGITADGGLISNVLDMARYLTMYMNRGEINGKRILSAKSIEEMEKPRIKTPFETLGGESYGLGWIITPNLYGYKLVGHSGSVLVYTAYAGYVPEKKIGVVLLANASGYPLSLIGLFLLSILLGKNPYDLEPLLFDKILDELRGRYETFKGSMRAIVSRHGDMLSLEMRDKLTETIVPLIPVEKLDPERPRFFTLSRGRRVEAEFYKKDCNWYLIYERYKFKKIGAQ